LVPPSVGVELTAGRTESVGHGKVGIFMAGVVARVAGDQLRAGDRDLHADLVLAPLRVMTVGEIDEYAAADDARAESPQLLDTCPHVGFESGAGRHLMEGDLNGGVHAAIHCYRRASVLPAARRRSVGRLPAMVAPPAGPGGIFALNSPWPVRRPVVSRLHVGNLIVLTSVMWLAHLLTIVRIPLGGLFWLVVDRPGAALLVLTIGAATDVIDGHIARFVMRRRAARGQPPPSRVGEWLDPLCDKTFVLSVLLAVWWRLSPPTALVLAVAARELILVPVAAVYRFTPWLRRRLHYRFRAGPLGKAATVVQVGTLAALLFGHPATAGLAALCAGVGLLAAVDYVLRGVRLAREQSMNRPAALRSA
jgi:cardiolipin synthase